MPRTADGRDPASSGHRRPAPCFSYRRRPERATITRSHTTALPSPEGRLLRAVLWERLDQPGMELCRLHGGEGSFRLEGAVLVTADDVPAEVAYDVTCSDRWETEAVRVAVTSRGGTNTVELRRESGDRWWRDGMRMHALDGTTDVDLGFTPATNTLPIRRLQLEIGASASVDAAWLAFPDLRMEVLQQRYTRLDESRYRYEAAGGAFVADLEIDELGLVVLYGKTWQRVAP